jgi:hypothetical protein
MCFTDIKPAEGFSPKPMDLPTREKEKKNEINWQEVFGQFSCVIGNIWLQQFSVTRIIRRLGSIFSSLHGQ